MPRVEFLARRSFEERDREVGEDQRGEERDPAKEPIEDVVEYSTKNIIKLPPSGCHSEESHDEEKEREAIALMSNIHVLG